MEPADVRSRSPLTLLVVVALALGALALGYRWGHGSGSEELSLRTHAIYGTVSVADADGFCVSSGEEERCARLVSGVIPDVGQTVRAEWVAFPSDDEGVLLWSGVQPEGP